MGIRCHLSIKFVKTNRIAPDGTLRYAASHLGLFCLPMSHIKDVRLVWVNTRRDELCIFKSVIFFLADN